MVPPPDNTGDEFPDFEHMTLEEQMAWLESLAKRQGAKEEELTTAADLDIPVPENAEIDEPGYVPYSIREGAASESARADRAPEQEPEPERVAAESQEEILSAGEFEAVSVDAGLEAPDLEEDFALGLDDSQADEEGTEAMPWLDDLAARSEEELEDLGLLTEIEVPEPPETEEEAEAIWDVPEEEFEPELEQVDFDLESGVEDVTALEEPPLEPEIVGEEAPVLAEVSFDDEGYEDEALSALADVVEDLGGEPALDTGDDVLDGVDPMLWLESLAVRQGARQDELTTSADLDVAEVPEGTIIDEPGYVPYDVITGDRRVAAAEESASELESAEVEPEVRAYGTAGAEEEPVPLGEDAGSFDEMDWLDSLTAPVGEQAEETLGVPIFEELAEEVQAFSEQEPEGAEEELLPEFEATDESLSWLEELASEQGEDVSELLAFDEEGTASLAEVVSTDDPLAGMTEEDIAYAQAHGLLTTEQERAWLLRQAEKLAEIREVPEEYDQGPIEPAEPVELPEWLEQVREEGEAEPAALADELPLAEAVGDVSDWLEDVPEGEAVMADLAFESDIDSLWAETSDEGLALEETEITESELKAFLEGDMAPEKPDQLAEALDAEYERKIIGDDSEPEWYTEALERDVLEAPEAAEPEGMTEITAEEAGQVLEEAAPVEMPDWLKEPSEEEVFVSSDDMPDWLAERTSEVYPESEPVTPEWLTDTAQATMPAAETFMEPPAAPVEAGAGVSRPAPIPQDTAYDEYRKRLAQDPRDFANRLALARTLRTHQEIGVSLDHYEILVEESQLLGDVSQDLSNLLQDHPENPRMNRLLGDTFMRRGLLQDALNAYRKALDQL